MSAPLSTVVPPGIGDKVPPEPHHPGVYTGDDAVAWAQNKVACLHYINIGLRRNLPVTQALIDINEREAGMLLLLLTNVAKSNLPR